MNQIFSIFCVVKINMKLMLLQSELEDCYNHWLYSTGFVYQGSTYFLNFNMKNKADALELSKQ